MCVGWEGSCVEDKRIGRKARGDRLQAGGRRMKEGGGTKCKRVMKEREDREEGYVRGLERYRG